MNFNIDCEMTCIAVGIAFSGVHYRFMDSIRPVNQDTLSSQCTNP